MIYTVRYYSPVKVNRGGGEQVTLKILTGVCLTIQMTLTRHSY